MTSAVVDEIPTRGAAFQNFPPELNKDPTGFFDGVSRLRPGWRHAGLFNLRAVRFICDHDPAREARLTRIIRHVSVYFDTRFELGKMACHGDLLQHVEFILAASTSFEFSYVR